MPEVQGPDGQRYQFPEGTSPDVMKSAMAKRYPKKQAPSLADGLGVSMPSQEQFEGMRADAVSRDTAFEQQLSERGAKRRASLESDPENIGWSSPKTDAQLGATQYGKSDGLFLGFGDEVVGLFNPEEGKRRSDLKQYARRAYPQDFDSGEMQGGVVNALASAPVAAPKIAQASRLVPAIANAPTAVKTMVAGGASGSAWDAAQQVGTSTGGLEDRAEQFDVGRNATAAGVSAAAGGLLQGAAGLLSKGDQKSLMADAIADIDTIGETIRPQSLKAFNRLLSKSGLSDSDIIALHGEVSNRLSSVQGGAAGRKRAFQHYMEVLADDETSALYSPQAASNILMTVQERANSALPGDTSRGIVGAAVKADRASQVPFLEESAQNVAQGTRIGTDDLVKSTRSDLGSQYEAALDPAQISPMAQKQALDMIASIRPLLDGPSGLKVQAAAEGIDVDQLIAQNPMKALHWIQSAARRKGQSADPNRAAYMSLRQRALPVIENNVDQYGTLRREYASNEGIDKAKTFGDRLFGGAQSNMMNNPGMRGEMVREFQALTDREKEIALVSIRDQALGKITGGTEDAPARLSQLNTRAALDFLEQVGQKDFADDIRSIGRENQLLSVADAGNPLRQSATFSNAQARAEAPALYNGTIANAVDNSTPGTMLGEGMLMAFAPHYQGAYAAYRGGRMAAAAGFGTRKKTLEDMTRFLMARPDAQPANSFTPPAATPTATPQVANAFAPNAAPVAAAQGNPVTNGLPIGIDQHGGIMGAGAGYGFAPDLNGDGEVSQAERVKAASIGFVGGRIAKKGAQRLNKTRPAGMLQYDEAKLRVMNMQPEIHPGTPAFQKAVEADMLANGYGGKQSKPLRDTLNPPEQVNQGAAPDWKMNQGRAIGEAPSDTILRDKIDMKDYGSTISADHLPIGQRIDAIVGGMAEASPDGQLSDDAWQTVSRLYNHGITKDEVAQHAMQGGRWASQEEVVQMHPWLFEGPGAARLPQGPTETGGFLGNQRGSVTIGGGRQRGQTQEAIRDGLREAGGRSRAPVSIETGQPAEALPDNLRQVVDETNPIPGVKPSSRTDVLPEQARAQLRDDLLRAGDDPQQVDQLIEILGDDVVQVLRDRQLGPAVSRGVDSGSGDGGEGLGMLLGMLGVGGAATAIQMAMRDSGNPRASLQDVMRALDAATRQPRGLPPTPSLKPMNAFAL